MSQATSTGLMTAEAFQALPERTDGVSVELVRGELVEMSKPGIEHSYLMLEVAVLLRAYAAQIGGVAVGELGFLLERSPDSVRAPDAAYFDAATAPAIRDRRLRREPATLVVEIVSPNDNAADVAEKAQWWLTHGTAEVWVVEPRTRTLTAYRPAGAAHVYGYGDTFAGSAALPDLSFALADLFK